MAVPLNEGVAWLKSLQRFGIKPGLERTRRVLAACGNPQDDLRFFHVAGTNGKGSVCAMLTALLSRGGRVGTFISPAFDGYRGRFVVSGAEIGATAFESLAVTVRDLARHAVADDPLTEFEALTVMAILYFHDHQVDAVVWETGLGGRYDSTSVVTPVVTAITNVTYDHTEILGDTLAQIAWDKAGIIKRHVPVITAAEDTAYLVIDSIAAGMEAPLWKFAVHFQGVRVESGPRLQMWHYRGHRLDVHGIPLSLLGAHQCKNAAVALAMYEAGLEQGLYASLSDAQIREAFATVVWPGRFEVFDTEGPPVVVDGAHNSDGARTFATALAEYALARGFDPHDWTMVIGILQDKDTAAMLQAVLPLAGYVVATQPDTDRAISAVVLANDIRAQRGDVPVVVAETVRDALSLARATEKPVCCWGSLYTVDEARQAMLQLE